MDKKNIMICGVPNTVLRIFVEHLSSRYDIFFISYSRKFQYPKIKEILRGNAVVIDMESTKSFFNKFYNALRFLFIAYRIASKKNIKIFLAHHNHFIKNGMIMLMMKWFFRDVDKIYFPYDIVSYAHPKEFKYDTLSRLSFFFDRICFEKCDKIITKGSEDELIYLREIYKIFGKPHFVFNFLVEKKGIVNKDNNRLNRDKINLVFIGGVDDNIKNDNNYTVIQELLSEKKILLHIYSHKSERIKSLMHHENLIIHDYITQHDKLIKEISKFDFGTSISTPPYYDFIQAKMASGVRLYDYLAAGLPIIIDDEHTLMNSIVTKNNFGFVIPLKDAENIIKYIDQCDYPSLVSSVRKNREDYFVEKNIDKLTLFLDK